MKENSRLRYLLEIAQTLQNNEDCDRFWNQLTKPEYRALRRIMKF
jgi:hypothetical protein